MTPVLEPLEEFRTSLVSEMDRLLSVSLRRSGRLPDEDHLRKDLYLSCWRFLKDRLGVSYKQSGEFWDVPQLIRSIRQRAGITDGEPIDASGPLWPLRMPNRLWHLFSQGDPFYQELWLEWGRDSRSLSPAHSPGGRLLLTDRPDEMVFLMDVQAKWVDDTIRERSGEALRRSMIRRIRRVTAEAKSSPDG